jgi:coenzyme F420-reducing hydrogenase beta subunit
MAHNIANQTYKNIEWIIVDDYPKNREALAKEYAKKYGIDIKYLRSKKRKVKRTYGLVNAENTGWMAAKGEMLYAWTTDAELQNKAECGGAVTALLKYALESKAVDAVLAVDGSRRGRPSSVIVMRTRTTTRSRRSGRRSRRFGLPTARFVSTGLSTSGWDETDRL